jgi:5,5'-dehydrodivanillate O-demethylase
LVFAWLGDDEPAEFPLYPALDGDGVIETIVYMRRCNYFNNIDNQLDEAHVTFVHQDAFYRVTDLPLIEARATEYGAMTSCPRPSGSVRVTHFLMPNITQLKSPGADREIDWTEYMVWRVPIDDHSHYTFGINYINVLGDAKARYLARRDAVKEAPPPPIEELGERIIRGELTIENAKKNLDERDVLYHVYLEDYAVQVSQGVVADRSEETLGRSDNGVILLRELWTEELCRLAHGEPPTKWTRPEVMETTTGELAVDEF